MSSSDQEANLHTKIDRLNDLKENVSRTVKQLDEKYTLLRINTSRLLPAATVVDKVKELDDVTTTILDYLDIATHLRKKIEGIQEELQESLEYFRHPSKENRDVIDELNDKQRANENRDLIDELNKEIHSIEETHHDCSRGYYRCLTNLQSLHLSLTPRYILTTEFPSQSTDNNKKVECCSCLDPFVALMRVKQCPKCSNYFHEHCVEKWFQTLDRDRKALHCPHCRQLLARA